MRLEELEKLNEEDSRIEYKKLGRIRREFRDLKLILKTAVGYRPSKEEIERNLNTWEGRLFDKRPIISAGILLGLASIPVASFVYTLVTVAEYIKNIYTN
jgi:hypothetical protein